MTNLISMSPGEQRLPSSEPTKKKWTWRPKEEREAAKREREIRRERCEMKMARKEERQKRREIKAALRHDLATSPKKEPDAYQTKLKCRNCGGGMIVAMPRDPETGDNLPICERCL